MKKGFTLIEVIMSIALIALLIAVTTSLNLSIIHINLSSRDRDNTFYIAKGVCEIFKSENINFFEGNYVGVYKYIDRLSDVTSIKDMFYTKDGDYFQGETVSNISGKGYILILELLQRYSPNTNSTLEPQLITLKVTVIKRRTLNSEVILMDAK